MPDELIRQLLLMPVSIDMKCLIQNAWALVHEGLPSMAQLRHPVAQVQDECSGGARAWLSPHNATRQRKLTLLRPRGSSAVGGTARSLH